MRIYMYICAVAVRRLHYVISRLNNRVIAEARYDPHRQAWLVGNRQTRISLK